MDFLTTLINLDPQSSEYICQTSEGFTLLSKNQVGKYRLSLGQIARQVSENLYASKEDLKQANENIKVIKAKLEQNRSRSLLGKNVQVLISRLFNYIYGNGFKDSKTLLARAVWLVEAEIERVRIDFNGDLFFTPQQERYISRNLHAISLIKGESLEKLSELTHIQFGSFEHHASREIVKKFIKTNHLDRIYIPPSSCLTIPTPRGTQKIFAEEILKWPLYHITQKDEREAKEIEKQLDLLFEKFAFTGKITYIKVHDKVQAVFPIAFASGK